MKKSVKNNHGEPHFADWLTAQGEAKDNSIRKSLGYPPRHAHGKSSFDLLIDYLHHPVDADWTRSAFENAMFIINPPLQGQTALDWRASMHAVMGDELAARIDVHDGPSLCGRLDENSVPFLHWLQVRQDCLKSKDPDGLRLAWLLDDAEERRTDPAFETLWTGFWRVMNVFQFLPGAMFLTTTGVATHLYEFLSLSSPAKHPATGITESEAAWSEALEFARPDCLEFLDALRSAGISAPTMGYEILQRGLVAGEAEMAWDSTNVAILSDEHAGLLPFLEEQQWQVILLQQALKDPTRVIRALASGPKHASD